MLHEFVCHPCAGTMLILSVFIPTFVYLLPKQAPAVIFKATHL